MKETSGSVKEISEPQVPPQQAPAATTTSTLAPQAGNNEASPRQVGSVPLGTQPAAVEDTPKASGLAPMEINYSGSGEDEEVPPTSPAPSSVVSSLRSRNRKIAEVVITTLKGYTHGPTVDDATRDLG